MKLWRLNFTIFFILYSLQLYAPEQGIITPVHSAPPPISYTSYEPRDVELGSITINSSSDPRYRFDFQGTLKSLKPGFNILGSANGAEGILPPGDSYLFGNNPGILLDKEKKVTFNPAHKDQAATITLSYNQGLDFNRRLAGSTIYIVGYFPKAVSDDFKYFTFEFDNRQFIANLQKLIGEALADMLIQAQDAGNEQKRMQFMKMGRSVQQGRWNITPYFLNIAFSPQGSSLGGGVHPGDLNDPSYIYHPLDIRSIDVPMYTYDSVNQPNYLYATLSFDRSQLENIPGLINTYWDVPPEGIPGKINGGAS